MEIKDLLQLYKDFNCFTIGKTGDLQGWSFWVKAKVLWKSRLSLWAVKEEKINNIHAV